ncbi:integrase [Stutzerimonas stutzeri]|nr:integrase [Stutzerimonas stutzeri]
MGQGGLMAIRQLADGRWKVDVEPVKGKRFRKTFRTKGEAQRFEATCRSKSVESHDWSPRPKDKRRLSELVELWFELHGVSLSDGVRRLAILQASAKALGDPVARMVDGARIAAVRARWIAAGVSGKTANNRLGYLKAVYNELHKLDVIDYGCPFTRIRPVKLQERPLAYLTKPQIVELLAALDERVGTSPHPAMVARICLATGARWGEAQALRPERIRGNALVFANTKSKRVRMVPVTSELVSAIKKHWQTYGPFTNCIGVFRLVLLSTSIKPPRGQASHILRHTFAAHFIMGGGHIVTLKEILGHASLNMTMRYAHLAPEHLHDAIRLGPLASINYAVE